MSQLALREEIESFLREPAPTVGRLTNERSLQLELGLHLRARGWAVQFEVPLRANRLTGSTLRQKTYLDLMVHGYEASSGIELKVPLNGQHPETIYSFCADIEFLESIRRAKLINAGLSLMVTHDPAFWRDSGRGSIIHNAFRGEGLSLSGRIEKPTGAKDSCVVLEKSYYAAGCWHDVAPKLMTMGRYLLIDV